MRDAMRLLLVVATALLALPLRAQEQPDHIRTGRLLQVLNLHFETGESVLHPSSIPALDAVAELLRHSPDLRIQISGHTDTIGSDQSNQALSLERARSVQAFFVVRHGIDPRRLEVAGFGESLPIALNSTPTGRALNRRVEFRALESIEEPAPVAEADPDSIRLDIQKQIEEAVRAALGENQPRETSETAMEDVLLERIDAFQARLEEEEEEEEEVTPQGPETSAIPFSGIYLRGDLPVLMGLRLDIPTTLLGSAHLQPEAAVGFRPNKNAYVFGANLAFPIAFGSGLSVYPGAGIGFHNLDGFESVLTLLLGMEYPFEIGIVFGEVATQDFLDFNRVVIGYRQPF